MVSKAKGEVGYAEAIRHRAQLELAGYPAPIRSCAMMAEEWISPNAVACLTEDCACYNAAYYTQESGKFHTGSLLLEERDDSYTASREHLKTLKVGGRFPVLIYDETGKYQDLGEWVSVCFILDLLDEKEEKEAVYSALYTRGALLLEEGD